ncbi:MAG: UDP-N-acetylmuramoyl-L-alanyl-D-glutamate--2,6-diaminopimelate ligase [Clostridia bacterium]|nr:UDP-N-acetylmuramoyl-L-alanyl-D-glutamate--2,6-diaminopimelate ligase [Clostridia bacterium]
MLISQLFASCDLKSEIKNKDIKLITDDSRKCSEGSIFVCHNSAKEYVNEALKNGADLVVAEEKICDSCVVVHDTRIAYAELCAAYFGHCHKNIKMIGVTGTNGKTTTANMIYTVLSLSGKKCGLMGTVKNNICCEEKASELTTPDPFELHKMLRALYEWGAEYCVIEASSQGLHQKRLYGIDFYISVLTNISEDHLDYHENMENYVEAKKELFRNSHISIINVDDKYKDEFAAVCKGKVITYSMEKNDADFVAKCQNMNQDGSDYAVVADYLIHRIKINMPGKFNVMNSLAAVAAGYVCNVSLEGCAHALRSFGGVKGRMELIAADVPYKIMIDYAHTPDSLKKVLLTLKNFSHNRIITVFGCGGDRDKEKRPLMGSIASQLSDIVIVTSDNPRSEKPLAIIDDILSGIKNGKKTVYIHENRKKAIEYALKIAQKDDIILLAGKGHETSQKNEKEVIPMDERRIVLDLIDSLR